MGRLVDLHALQPNESVGYLLHPRFAVAQWRQDGSVKIRDVDHFSWAADFDEASINEMTVPQEKMHHDTIDKLGALLRTFKRETGQIPGEASALNPGERLAFLQFFGQVC